MSFWDSLHPPPPKWGVSEMPDLTGKVALVTGGNSGIGYETCLALMNVNATVLILCRSADRANDAIERLKKAQSGKGTAIFIQCDLGSIASVRQAAKDVEAQTERLDMLFANAGVMNTPIDAVTSDGYEMQFGTNVLGHYVLVSNLVPLLQRTARAIGPSNLNAVRVCITSSNGHLFGPSKGFVKEDVSLKKTKYRFVAEMHKMHRYGHSKTGNILLANKLHRLYGHEGIVFTSCHPGTLRTEIQRHQPKWVIDYIIGSMLQPAPMGAITQLYACTAPEAASLGGVYLTAWARPSRARKVAYDTKVQDDLWQWCEQQVQKH